LGGVFRILSLPEHSVTKPEYGSLIPLDQVDHRGLISGQATLDEISEIVRQLCFPGPSRDRYPRGQPVVSPAGLETLDLYSPGISDY